MYTVRRLSALAVCFVVSCGEGSTAPIDIPSAHGLLAVGELTACALDATNSLYCWGANTATYFEYGMNPTVRPASDAPVRVSAPPLVSLVPGASEHMCGQASATGTVYCWGRGGFGQLGTGTLEPPNNTYATVLGSSWRVVTVSRLMSCGVTTLGTGLCWGLNQRGEIGTTAVAIRGTSPMPVPVETTQKFKMIAAGWLHACGITTDDLVMCWGDNRHGQLGAGTIDDAGDPADAHRRPVTVASQEKFAMLSAGALQTCGVTLDNRAFCWGDNETGQLGDGTTTDRSVPTAVATDQKFTTIAVGSGFGGGATAARPDTVSAGGVGHTCALTAQGTAFCWGWNGDGQLGDGTTTDRSTPVAVSTPIPFSTIGAGGAFTCGMRGHQVWCWGANSFGQVGYGQGIGGKFQVPRLVAAPFDKP